MITSGIIALVLGVACCILGILQNSSTEAKLRRLFESGSANPGTVFIVIGAVLVVVGIILLSVGIAKKNKK